ncbi:hypothetical protein PR048_005490 [Dryococelus australis]|uniref:Mutator-like transposase domain-containing protein n=1 Tax=Dryococelus australis TaxID=614101 RepID=A0ABQ9I8B7_9NEOP|nr:hypothetical protein PR048_005490 [Dryococelus australis]
MSENHANKDTFMPINKTAVHSILARGGGGYSQLGEFSAGVEKNCMNAAEEEKAIAIRDGNVDSDGVAMCTVVADEGWCKRSYNTIYDSLSDVVSIQCWFQDRKDVIYIGVRNRYCSLCASCQNAQQTLPSHTYFLDWKKSATSLGADIIADSFLQSEKLLGLKFNKLIGPKLMAEKVECKNNVLCNYCHKLTDLIKNTKFPVTSRNLLKQQIPRFRTAVDKAIHTELREMNH